MYIEQSDLFWGMDKDFLKEIFSAARKETYEKGDLVFRDGEKAGYFYILVKGRIDLITGETGQVVHVASHPGEAIGWSSLVGRKTYSASAECREPTKLVKIESERLQEALERNPSNGMVFFKHVAKTLGNRLLQSYKLIASEATPSLSIGTGQVQESAATLE